jgi:predicted enzyme related to lactoylglutathione lyase
MAVLSGSRVRAVMLFADDTHAVAEWWAAAFGAVGVTVTEDPQGDYVEFEVDGLEIGVHPADPERNPVGGSPVVYWSVASVESVRERLLRAGATPHRGPLAISESRSVCQLRDPYGNVFGLDGPP